MVRMYTFRMLIRILIADDHRLLAETFKILIEQQPDMQVVGLALDGRDAVRQVEALRPDIVVMDLAMPELNGAEATRALATRQPGCRVVVVSAYTDAERVRRALKAGAQGYLSKSGGADDLIAAIRAVHAGQRFLGPSVADVVINDDGAAVDPVERLSVREREILQLLAEGHTGAVIAQRLSLSQKTVETYRARVVEKLGIRDLPGLVRFAIQRGIVTLE
ncbi:MAG TPA: response regulator transcription factor [Burkholderiales bacterium]